MSRSSWGVILVLSTLAVSYGQRAETQDGCNFQENCTACIRTLNCAWCNAPITESTERCVDTRKANLAQRNQWCSTGEKVDPKTGANFVKNDSLTGKKNATSKQVQIQPQVIDLKLRRGEEYNFTLRYKQAEDYPVDLYFVADHSYSMHPFWNQLSKLGRSIVTAMKSLTSNFRLGFGSFVDKTVAPMVSDKPKWDGFKHFSFKNHMQLADDVEQFVRKVISAKLNGNSDDPEGGFDGVMQAMVCQKEIGWRPDARHLLVFVSDNSPHIAGDGRFAGLIEPNDMQCHLNDTGYYTHADLQDYPSIGQIKWQASENNINIIFVVREKFKSAYDKARFMIPGSSVGTLGKMSDNIAELISSHYENLIKSLTLASNSTSKFLDVKYLSRCLNANQDLQQRNKCDGIRVDDIIEFVVKIKAIDCPKNEEDWRQTIEIKPEGINEGVIVNVELICDCECSKKSGKAENAPRAKECHNHGILDCGVCSCDEQYYGKWCQCEGDKSLASEDKASCQMNNSSKTCSGHGNCICGSCTCGNWRHSEQKFYGKYCQCDDFSCNYSPDNKLCGGNGRCECGRCVCGAGWGGSACECRDDISLCRPPGANAKICSGAGKCECGRCVCDKETGRNGRYCEDCPSCPSQRCDEFKDCVECQVHKSGKIYREDSSCLKCSHGGITAVDKIEEDPDKTNPSEHVCRVMSDDGSTFVFTYMYANSGDENPTILAKKDKEFLVLSNFFAAGLGVVLMTLLIGFLIIVTWKIVTHVHDRREYQKFIKQRSNTNWGQGGNPLYRDAVTTVRNPTFDSVPDNDEL